MVTGVLVMGAGALLFMPAAAVPSYPLFLGALMILACGISILQVAANPYVAVLGPKETASSRLNLSQAFNSLGTTVAPLLGGYLILNAAAKSMTELRQMAPDALQAYRVHEASSVKVPYLIIGLRIPRHRRIRSAAFAEHHGRSGCVGSISRLGPSLFVAGAQRHRSASSTYSASPISGTFRQMKLPNTRHLSARSVASLAPILEGRTGRYSAPPSVRACWCSFPWQVPVISRWGA
jgi:MFS family permease